LGDVTVSLQVVYNHNFANFSLHTILYPQNISALFFLTRQKKSAQKKGLIEKKTFITPQSSVYARQKLSRNFGINTIPRHKISIYSDPPCAYCRASP
jgi:hypothetical protein